MLLALLILFAPLTQSDRLADTTAVVSGRVVWFSDDGREQPARHVQVVNSSAPRSPTASVDSAGVFSITVAAGESRLYFRSPFFDGHHENVAVSAGDTLQLIVTLQLNEFYAAPKSVGEERPRDETFLSHYHREIEKTLGLSPIDSTEGGASRELRIWPTFYRGEPNSMLRLLINGDHVTGELFIRWSYRENPLGPVSLRYKYEPVCEHIHSRATGEHTYHPREGPPRQIETGVQACRARFAQEPNWNAVLQHLERHRVWDLPDESLLPDDGTIALGGFGVRVSVRENGSVRSYYYNNPAQYHPVWEEPRHAYAIYRAVEMVRPFLVPTADKVVVRGTVTRDAYGTTFRACSMGEEWILGFHWTDPPEEILALAVGDSVFAEISGSLSAPMPHLRFEGQPGLDNDFRIGTPYFDAPSPEWTEYPRALSLYGQPEQQVRTMPGGSCP